MYSPHSFVATIDQLLNAPKIVWLITQGLAPQQRVMDTRCMIIKQGAVAIILMNVSSEHDR